MREAMRRRDVDSDFDALIPIPLSPDKAANGEIHRTRLLATELGTLLEAPVVEALALTESISKRAMQREGRLHEFEARYERALAVVENTSEFERVALIDDVSTRGGTLRVALQVLHASDPDLPVVPVTAAQMILRDVVVDEDRLRP
jgi:predicted amidophosphoribosyltransferase